MVTFAEKRCVLRSPLWRKEKLHLQAEQLCCNVTVQNATSVIIPRIQYLREKLNYIHYSGSNMTTNQRVRCLFIKSSWIKCFVGKSKLFFMDAGEFTSVTPQNLTMRITGGCPVNSTPWWLFILQKEEQFIYLPACFSYPLSAVSVHHANTQRGA